MFVNNYFKLLYTGGVKIHDSRRSDYCNNYCSIEYFYR